MTEEHDHNQDTGEQDAVQNAGNRQDDARQSDDPQTEAPQTEDQDAANQQSEGHQQAEGQQGATEEGSTTPEEPPAGTTTPGTLFASDEMEEMKSEEQKNKEAEAKKRKEAANQSGSSEKKYPKDTELRYSGHTKVLPEEMSEAQIFKWIADDFPEIEQGKWSLRYDSSKGRLVPVSPAQKKGAAFAEGSVVSASTEPPAYEIRTEPPVGRKPPVYRLLCDDGVYEVRTNLSGTYVARLDSELTLAEGYYPSVPKPPASLLLDVVRIFKERPDTEALIDLVYDSREEHFRLIWNQKQASASSVHYQPLPDDDNLVLYAEIHSHHKMAAFFSPTDSRAEIKTGVYGVVGRIEDDVPEAAFRYSCGGHFRELLAEDLFDDPSLVTATVRRPAQ